MFPYISTPCIFNILSAYHFLDSREEFDTGSALSAVPVIGPFLTPLIPILQDVGLVGSTADSATLSPAQVAALADLEGILSIVIYSLNVTSITAKAESTATLSAITPESTGSDAQDSLLDTDGITLETHGLLDLGSILTGLPIIGPFLKPLLPLLDSIGLGASSIASVDDIKTISMEQVAALAQLEFMLAEAVDQYKAKSDSSEADTPSKSSVSPAQASPSA